MSLLQDALKRKQEDDKDKPASASPNAIPPAAMLPIPPPEGAPSTGTKPILAPPPPAPVPPPPPEATMSIPVRPTASSKEPSAWRDLLLTILVIALLLGGVGYGGWFAWENFIRKDKTAGAPPAPSAPPAPAPARTTPAPGSVADRVQKAVAAANEHADQANRSMGALEPAVPATAYQTPGMAVATPAPPAVPAAPAPAPAPAVVTNLVKVVTITQTVAAAAPPEPPPPPPRRNIEWPVLKITGAVAGSGKKGFAIVNGQIMSLGEEVEGVTLKEVQTDRVVVEKEGQTKTLYLGAKKE